MWLLSREPKLNHLNSKYAFLHCQFHLVEKGEMDHVNGRTEIPTTTKNATLVSCFQIKGTASAF